jgi:hypothetical protein
MSGNLGGPLIGPPDVNLLIAEVRAASIGSTMRRYVPVSVRKPAQSR